MRSMRSVFELNWSLIGVFGTVVLLALALNGCRTHRGEHIVGAREECAEVGTQSGTNGLMRKEACVNVILSHEPQAFSFRTELLLPQTNLTAFIDSLKANGVKEINLESKLKLTTEDRQLYMTKFIAAGIRVGEFWVPIASRPGRVNLLAK